MKSSYSDPLDHLRSLLPEGKDRFNVKETASILHKSPQFVRDALRYGKIQGFALEGRSLNKAQTRSTYLIPRQSIVFYLLQHSNFGLAEYRLTLAALMAQATKSQLEYFKEHIDSLIEKNSNRKY